MPRYWASRIVAVLWMFTSAVFVALYTAQLTASLAVQQFHSEINRPSDLPGKPLARLPTPRLLLICNPIAFARWITNLLLKQVMHFKRAIQMFLLMAR